MKCHAESEYGAKIHVLVLESEDNSIKVSFFKCLIGDEYHRFGRFIPFLWTKTSFLTPNSESA